MWLIGNAGLNVWSLNVQVYRKHNAHTVIDGVPLPHAHCESQTISVFHSFVWDLPMPVCGIVLPYDRLDIDISLRCCIDTAHGHCGTQISKFSLATVRYR